MGENFFLNNKRLYPILELYNTQEEFKSKQTSKSRHIIASVHIENEQCRGNINRKKPQCIQRTEMRKRGDFSSKTMQAQKQWSNIFNILKQNAVNQIFQV